MRLAVSKASGSQYAHVHDWNGAYVRRFDIFKRYGRMDGWAAADHMVKWFDKALSDALWLWLKNPAPPSP